MTRRGLALLVLLSALCLAAQNPDATAVQELRARDVYIAPAARVRITAGDEASLHQLAQESAAAGIPLKLAVLDRPPEGFATLGQWVEAAHGALHLGDGILIAVALEGGGGTGSVSSKTDALDKQTIERLQERNVATFLATGIGDGMRALARDLAAEIERQQAERRARNAFLVGVLLIAVALGALALLGRSAHHWSQRLSTLEEARAGLYPLLRRLDDELPYIAGTPEGDQASALLADGSEAFDEATQMIDGLASLPPWRAALPGESWSQLTQASRALQVATEHLTEAVAVLDRALAAPASGDA